MTRWQLRMPDGALYDVEEVEHDREHSLVRLVDDPDPERGERLRVPRRWLVEARPPSVDDPVPWPLRIPDFVTGGVVVVEDSPVVGAAARVNGRDIDGDGLLTLAQGAWQQYQRFRAAQQTAGEGTE